MTDDFDDAIRSRFQQPSSTSSGNAQAVFDELRPAIRRARIKRSLAVGTATLSVLGLVGLGAFAVSESVAEDPTELDILIEGDPLPDVAPAPSTTEPERDNAEPTGTATTSTTTPPPTTQAPTTTAPEAATPITAEPQPTPEPPAQPTPDQPTSTSSPATTASSIPAPTSPPNTTTPAPTVPSSSTTSSTAPSTTGAPASGQQAIQSNCGSITVSWIGETISLIATQPVAGFSTEIENDGPEEVRVNFDDGDAECEIEAEIEAGTLRIDVKNDGD